NHSSPGRPPEQQPKEAGQSVKALISIASSFVLSREVLLSSSTYLLHASRTKALSSDFALKDDVHGYAAWVPNKEIHWPFLSHWEEIKPLDNNRRVSLDVSQRDDQNDPRHHAQRRGRRWRRATHRPARVDAVP